MTEDSSTNNNKHDGSSKANGDNRGTAVTHKADNMDVENGTARKRKDTDGSKVQEDGYGTRMEENLESHIQNSISQTWMVPDGGYGWVVMVCCLMISVIVDGVTYTFGVFLRDLEIAFQAPKSTITLANSLQVGLYLISGPVVSALTNRFGCRPVIIVGSFVAGISFVASAASPNVSVLILTYGVMGGIGFGMMYLPSVVAVSIYFDKKRALATGIAVCGSGIGTFALAPLSEYLLMEYNWRWTLVLLGGIIFNGILCGALIRPLEIKFADKYAKKNDFTSDDCSSLDCSTTSISGKNHSSKYSSPSSNRKIPESIPLITLTDDNETTLLVEPAAEKKTNNNNSARSPPPPPPHHPATSGPGNTRETNVKFFSSTPNFSLNQSPRSTEIFRKDHKSDSLPGNDVESILVKPRHRSNTIDYTNTKSNNSIPAFSSRADEVKPASKTRMHAPIGLAFIGVSDIHLNKIRDDVALPLSRRDINRSMMQIEFGELADGGEVHISRTREDSLAGRMTSLDDVTVKDKGLFSCLPESARETLDEMLNFSIFKDKRYWFILAGNFLCMLGFYVPFVYIPGRARELGMSDDKAAFLISVIGITNLVGRVAAGVLVNYLPIDSVLVTSVALGLCGVMTILCPFCETYVTLIVISALFGLCVAAYISLCSILLCELLGVRNLTNAFGYVILFRGIACIMGPPIAGALIDSTGQFDPAFLVGGSMIVLGSLSHFLLLTPCIRRIKSSY